MNYESIGLYKLSEFLGCQSSVTHKEKAIIKRYEYKNASLAVHLKLLFR